MSLPSSPESTVTRLDLTAAHRALTQLQRWNVTVLGWGSDGAAHALCLRDSGVDVRVGLLPDDPGREAALAEGFDVKDAYEACEEADLIMVLAPAHQQAEVYRYAVMDNVVPGDTVLFAHGFALRHGLIAAPAGVDVGLVQPLGSGDLLRREFAEGRGVPMLVAVAQDASGRASETVMGYAAGLGGTRAGIVSTTVAEATDAEAFGAAAVADGGIPELMRASWEVLVEAGCSPEVAYLTCMNAARDTIEAMFRRGLAGQRAALEPWRVSASSTPLLGEELKEPLRELLESVADGSLAEDFIDDVDDGLPHVQASRAEAASHPSESVGARLRTMMPWLRHDDEGAGRRWR